MLIAINLADECPVGRRVVGYCSRAGGSLTLIQRILVLRKVFLDISLRPFHF